MAPLIPVFLTLFSMFTAPVFAGSLDLSDYGADHRAAMDRQYEQQRAQWAAEEQAAQHRNEQAVRERNQPSEYQNSRDYNSTEHFSLWQGTQMQACTATKGDVSCY